MLFPILDVLVLLLDLCWWVVVAGAAMSWLIAFDVINPYHRLVRVVVNVLDQLTEPLYARIRPFLPSFSGLDFSPLVLLLIIFFLQRFIHHFYIYLLGG